MARLDHIAYRVKNKVDACNFFLHCFDYRLADLFDLQFADGSTCECFALEPPEKTMETAPFQFGEVWFNWNDPELGGHINYHLAPEIFISEGKPGSIVDQWVKENGPGIHHLAYEVTNIEKAILNWSQLGIKFTSSTPMECPGLKQIFTEKLFTGIIYELIERTDKGFCKENVKNLMESTSGI